MLAVMKSGAAWSALLVVGVAAGALVGAFARFTATLLGAG